MQMEALRPYVDFKITPGPEINEDEAFLDCARRTGASNWHPAGTYKMSVDPMAAVDPKLAVHGVEGPCVIDASIMPNVINGNTSAPTIMIAKKTANIILS